MQVVSGRRRPDRALRNLEDLEAMSFNACDSGTGAAWSCYRARGALLVYIYFYNADSGGTGLANPPTKKG